MFDIENLNKKKSNKKLLLNKRQLEYGSYDKEVKNKRMKENNLIIFEETCKATNLILHERLFYGSIYIENNFFNRKNHTDT